MRMLNCRADGFCPGFASRAGLGGVRTLFGVGRPAGLRGGLGVSAANCVV